MDNPKKKIAVIGCGHRSQSVLTNLFKANPDAIEITALMDPSQESIHEIKKTLAPNAVTYPTEKELLDHSKCDWVFIGSPNCHHANQAIAALQSGKHIFCEKPLATTLEDCIRLQQALAKAPDRLFFFGLVLRYTPLYAKIKEIIDSGELGRILSFEFNETLDFNHGGGIHGNWRRNRSLAGTHLLEKCCHDIDIANWLTGSLPLRVASFGGRDFFTPANKAFAESLPRNAQNQKAYHKWSHLTQVDPFSEGASIVDNQVAIIEYANGTRASFHTNCNAAIHERRLYIIGAHGTIRANAVTNIIEFRKIGYETEVQTINLENTGSHYGGDSTMGAALSKTILENTIPLAGLDDGIRASVSCFGVDEALDTGHVVNLSARWKQVGLSTVA